MVRDPGLLRFHAIRRIFGLSQRGKLKGYRSSRRKTGTPTIPNSEQRGCEYRDFDHSKPVIRRGGQYIAHDVSSLSSLDSPPSQFIPTARPAARISINVVRFASQVRSAGRRSL